MKNLSFRFVVYEIDDIDVLTNVDFYSGKSYETMVRLIEWDFFDTELEAVNYISDLKAQDENHTNTQFTILKTII